MTAKVLLASIPPMAYNAYVWAGRSPGVAQANAVIYNNALPGLCATKASEGKNVTFVDASSLTLEDDVSSDGVHLIQEGYDKMGTIFYNAVKNVLVPADNLGFANDFTSWFTYGTASIDTANVRFGSKSGYFSNGGGNYEITGLTPGASYSVKGWVKAVSGTDIWIVVTGYNGGAKTGAKMTSTSWTKSGDIIFTMGANDTSVTLSAWTGNGSSAYFDDFTILPYRSWIKVDDNQANSGISYDSDWTLWEGNNGYQNTEHSNFRNPTKQSEVTFNFTGTKVRYYGFTRYDLVNRSGVLG